MSFKGYLRLQHFDKMGNIKTQWLFAEQAALGELGQEGTSEHFYFAITALSPLLKS